jgi:hypothetical protein
MYIPTYFFSFVLFNLFYVHLFFIVSINKPLVPRNNVIKYNQVYTMYFEIKYLHPHLSLKSPI